MIDGVLAPGITGSQPLRKYALLAKVQVYQLNPNSN
jgi:hypothetical protein